MDKPHEVEKTVSKWLEEDRKLLSDLHDAGDIIRAIRELSKEGRSITKSIVEESNLKKSAVYRKLRKLSEHDLMFCKRGGRYHNREGRKVLDGRIKLYYLTEKGEKIAEYLDRFPLPERPSSKVGLSIPSQPLMGARAFHSERIRELLEKVIDEVPLMFSLEVCYPFPYPYEKRYDGEDLPVEGEVLFDDLGNHLKDFDRFNDSYSGFKKACRRFRQLKEDILEEMRLDLSKNFGLQFSPKWKRPDSFSLDMLEWIFEAGVYLAKKSKRRHFSRYFLDFKSNVEKRSLPDGRKTLEYRVAGKGFVQVVGKQAQAEVFKSKMDEKLRGYLEGLEDEPYYGEIRKAWDSLDKATDFREDLMKVLRQNLEMGIFPGDCEFLDAAVGTA